MFSTSSSDHKSIIRIGIAVWLLLSTFYVANDVWSEFKEGQLQAAYQQGVADSVISLMKESAKCEPITVFAQDQQVQLIPVECLQSQE